MNQPRWGAAIDLVRAVALARRGRHRAPRGRATHTANGWDSDTRPLHLPRPWPLTTTTPRETT